MGEGMRGRGGCGHDYTCRLRATSQEGSSRLSILWLGWGGGGWVVPRTGTVGGQCNLKVWAVALLRV